MSGETDIRKLIKDMDPVLHSGEYVFSTVKNINEIKRADTICEFKENEGVTVVIEKEKARLLNLSYEFVASWITLNIQSSLNAVGFTALFSSVLAENGISCNVIAGYYHDHIFVPTEDASKAIKLLKAFSKNQ